MLGYTQAGLNSAQHITARQLNQGPISGKAEELPSMDWMDEVQSAQSSATNHMYSVHSAPECTPCQGSTAAAALAAAAMQQEGCCRQLPFFS